MVTGHSRSIELDVGVHKLLHLLFPQGAPFFRRNPQLHWQRLKATAFLPVLFPPSRITNRLGSLIWVAVLWTVLHEIPQLVPHLGDKRLLDRNGTQLRAELGHHGIGIRKFR